MRCWVLTPNGVFHEAPHSEWESLPREVVTAGTHGQGSAGSADFYEVRHGRVVGTNTAHRLARRLGITVEALETDPRVKIGTDVPDEEFARFCALVVEYVAKGCGCGG